MAATPSPGVPAATPVAMATPASLGELIVPRGALQQVFISSDNAVYAVASTGESTRVFETSAGERILAFDSSPDATRVAVLIESGSAGSRNLLLRVLDDQGEEELLVREFAGTAGTPVAGDVAGVYLVDWSPQGKRALVALNDGSIFTVDLEGSAAPTPIEIPAPDSAILSPAWSPTGESIAFIAASDADRKRALSVYNIVTGALTEAVRPLNGRFVVDFAWMPDGVSLLFTEGGDLAGAVSGIDLWRIDADGENRELVASAGAVAPVARIANASPSPDGRSVAYAVQVPGAGTPRLDSVWVRDLASGIGFRVPFPPVASVEEIWWTDQGVVVSAITRGSTQDRAPVLAIFRVKPDGTTDILWAAPIVAATPVSSTPRATPVGD